MKEYEAYLEIARRFIKASEEQDRNNINVHEVIAFLSYHAFESAGSAYISYNSRKVPKSHPKKINAFISIVSNKPEKIKRPIAAVASALFSIRNKLLYPEGYNGNYKLPSNQLSPSQARRIVKRVKGIVKIVEKELK